MPALRAPKSALSHSLLPALTSVRGSAPDPGFSLLKPCASYPRQYHCLCQRRSPQGVRDTLHHGSQQRSRELLRECCICSRSRVSASRRDVKPSNILLTEDGHAKVSDMGLSRADFFSSSIAFAGTFMYAAPEVLLGRPSNEKVHKPGQAAG